MRAFDCLLVCRNDCLCFAEHQPPQDKQHDQEYRNSAHDPDDPVLCVKFAFRQTPNQSVVEHRNILPPSHEKAARMGAARAEAGCYSITAAYRSLIVQSSSTTTAPM